jgi:hypothetical protein
MTYIANSFVEHPAVRRQSIDLKKSWQNVETMLQSYFDDSLALLEQHHNDIRV